jgi:hypothetical protein
MLTDSWPAGAFTNLAQLPPIKRARGFRLYTYSGQRYLDLFLNNGTALTGHTPQAYAVAVKNPVEQGLYTALPGLWQRRLKKAVEKKFNCAAAFFYREPDTPLGLVRPLETPQFIDTPLRLVIPEPLQLYTILLSPAPLPEPDALIPSFLCRASLRALNRFDTLTVNRPLAAVIDRYPHLWKRRALYIESTLDETAYAQLYRLALCNNVLLPPHHRLTGALPAETSAYELETLDKIFSKFPL